MTTALEEIQTLPRELHPHHQRLIRAAELIEERGLCRWDFRDDLDQLCIRGAWYEAAGKLVYTGGWWHPDSGDLGYRDREEEEALPGWAADWNNGLGDEDGADRVAQALRRVAAGETWEEVVPEYQRFEDR